MKTTLLLTALLCGSAQADFIADIYKTPSGAFEDPRDMVFAGSLTYPSDPHSPALSLGLPNFDWHPFGLTWFTADIHGTLDILQTGTGRIVFSAIGNAHWGINGVIDLEPSDTGWASRQPITLTPGQYDFDLTYHPELWQNNDGQRVPTGKSGFAVVDADHAWFDDKLGVPDSGAWLLWLMPAGILLLVLRTSEKQKGEL